MENCFGDSGLVGVELVCDGSGANLGSGVWGRHSGEVMKRGGLLVFA